MRLLSIANVKPGQLVARAVMDSTGRVLLQQGVALTDAYIQALGAKGFTRLYVTDEDEAVNIPVEEDVSPAVRANAFQVLHQAYESIEKEVVQVRGESAKRIEDALRSDSVKTLIGGKGPLAHIHAIIGQILNEMLSRSTLAGMTSIKSADTRIYNHSIDVCAVSIMIGRVIGLDNPRLRQLGAGALLHDIGAIFLDPEVRGTRRIIQHTKLGYELLKNSEEADLVAPHVAYEHHEQQNGSGLPRGLRGSNTIERDRNMAPPIPTLIGEIAAVANAYDNLLNGALNRDPQTPDVALGTVRSMAGTELNAAVVKTFLRVVPVFPQGTEIIVREGPYRGYSGVVAKVNSARLDRPVITLTLNSSNEKIEPEQVDLADATDIEIRSKGL